MLRVPRIFTIAKNRAHAAGHAADHVNYLGLGGTKDWQLIATIHAKEYAFVTNNRSDFLALHGQEPLHARVIIIVSSVTPARQRELFSAAFKHIGVRDPTNPAVQLKFIGCGHDFRSIIRKLKDLRCRFIFRFSGFFQQPGFETEFCGKFAANSLEWNLSAVPRRHRRRRRTILYDGCLSG